MRRAAGAALRWLVLVAPVAAAAADSRQFHADLAAEWQTRYTESGATGRADFQLDLATLTLSWTVAFDGLSGTPRAITLHAPAQPGANGAKVLELAAAGSRSPVRGSAVISAAQVQYLLYGWSYVNLATAKFPWGEIRGQLDVRPPQAAQR